jgi:hypothetical protein
MVASDDPTQSQKRVIIFESYAWHDAQEIAKRLRRDLEARGFDVWLDVERMQDPDRWSMEIVEAIDRADVVLALLSPQAVRTVASPDNIDGQDSVVHYELQHARHRRKPIVPVLVLACTAPPLLGTLPLDWSDWHRSEESYRQGVDRIVDTLVQASQGHANLYSRLSIYWSRLISTCRLRGIGKRSADVSGFSKRWNSGSVLTAAAC